MARGPGKRRLPVEGREWTELTVDARELMVLLGMPGGTRLISIRYSPDAVKFTVEEPGGHVPGRLAKLVATRVIHPVVVAYLTHCVEDDDPEDVKPGFDPRGTIAADTAVAANRDHDVLDVIARRQFGFTSGRAR